LPSEAGSCAFCGSIPAECDAGAFGAMSFRRAKNAPIAAIQMMPENIPKILKSLAPRGRFPEILVQTEFFIGETLTGPFAVIGEFRGWRAFEARLEGIFEAAQADFEAGPILLGLPARRAGTGVRGTGDDPRPGAQNRWSGSPRTTSGTGPRSH